MKAKEKQETYRSFLNTIELTQPLITEDVATSTIMHFRPRHHAASCYSPAMYLLDFATKKYLYVEESCFDIMGYSSKEFLEIGLEGYFSKWHPSDFSIINTRVFPENLQFLRSISPALYNDYIFSYNYRLCKPMGEYVTILQRSSYIAGTAADGTPADSPVGVIGVTFDITHFKTDLSVIHTIEKVVNTPEGLRNELVFKQVHPIFDKPCLSNREKEIIQLLAKGESSKQIAGVLNISIHTIHNHRKNMLAKTGCRSSSELVNFAMKHGLLI